jgi:hypothetical protein
VREVDTAIGILTMPKEISQDKVDAEIKGIKLFKQIIDSSKKWKINDAMPRNPIIYCKVGELTIKLNPFPTILNSYLMNNFHFVLSINNCRVCVISKSHENGIAVIDSMISFLLLGDAGWPIESTPKTMEDVSIEQQLVNCYSQIDIDRENRKLSFTTSDKKELFDAVSEIEKGNSWQGLAAIMRLARTKYVCSVWAISRVVDEFKPFINSCNDLQIAQYFENPFEPADRIFLKKMFPISNV